MAEYDPTNRGMIYLNKRKAPGSNQPDRTGSLNVEGVEYFFDGWLKKTQDGDTYLSVSIKKKNPSAGRPQQSRAPAGRPAQTGRPAPAPRPAGRQNTPDFGDYDGPPFD